MYVYAGQTNVVSLPLVAKASGDPITTGTVNFYLKNLTTDKWYRGSDTSWQDALSIAGVAAHDEDGSWDLSLVSAVWTLNTRYKLMAKESGDLHIPVSVTIVCIPTDVSAAVITHLNEIKDNDDGDFDGDKESLHDLRAKVDTIVPAAPTNIEHSSEQITRQAASTLTVGGTVTRTSEPEVIA